MCGFAGVVSWDDRYRIDRDTLLRMSRAIAHRGPDGQEISLNHENQITPENPQCGLAFARLAILDLDPRAMQPMTDGHRTIVFNGEIYNFRELRKELDDERRYQWKTTGDTEVILHAYSVWREKCVDHLEGMFAFAIFDKQENTVFLARDRMGQKPLYFAAAPDGSAIAFASELAALRCLSWPDTSLDLDSLAGYLENGYVASPATIYRGIRKLAPACILVCDGTDLPALKFYFDPNTIVPDATLTAAETASLVRAAVSRQLISDVPVGCFLSGGIDSSVIAAAMKATAGQRVLTFSIGFDDPRYDETRFAAAVAKHLGTEHQSFIVKPDAAEDLPKLAAVFGEPFADSSALPTHYLARETRKHVKVALSGDGGDELFGGYERYRAMQLAQAARKMPRFVRNILAGLPAKHPKSHLSKIRRFARSLELPDARRYAQYMSLFEPEQIDALIGNIALPRLVESVFGRLSVGRDPVEAAAATDRITYLPEDVLTKVDRGSMLHALEVRSPFLEHGLVARCAGLRSPQLLQGGPKRLLREAFARDLPEFVFRRAKMGFAVPIGQWLRGDLRGMLTDLVLATDSFASAHFRKPAVVGMIEEHMANRIDHSQRLYALLMLELWNKQGAPT